MNVLQLNFRKFSFRFFVNYSATVVGRNSGKTRFFYLYTCPVIGWTFCSLLWFRFVIQPK